MAARNGASERSIMKQTGHRSVAMVRRYIHDAELFNDNRREIEPLGTPPWRPLWSPGVFFVS
jgi:hypothetical protein